MKICIFEDDAVSNLAPVNYLRHTSELICGVNTLLDKIKALAGKKTELTLHSRPFLENYLREKYPHYKINSFDEGDYLFLNSKVIFSKTSFGYLSKEYKNGMNRIYSKENTVLAFTLSADKVALLNMNGLDGLG